MDKTRFFVDWETVNKTELYKELVKWVNKQRDLFQERCSTDKDVDTWRRNQGRVDAFVKMEAMLLHPEKLLDKEKSETTDYTGDGLA